MPAPLLVFGWGNPSRADDALGPLFVRALAAIAGDLASRVEVLEDYQLQVEHALDLVGRQRVLFVDASLSCAAPFEVTAVRPAKDATFTTHAISPALVMQVYQNLYGVEAPPCTLLAIRGVRFDLGEEPGASALAHLEQALAWGKRWLAMPPAELPSP